MRLLGEKRLILRTVAIELTNHCNLNCEMCVAKKREIKGYMDKRFFEKLIHQLELFPFVKVGFGFGGEPTLHPYASKLIEYACSSKIKRLGITTNGTFLDRIPRHKKLEVKVSVHRNFSEIEPKLEGNEILTLVHGDISQKLEDYVKKTYSNVRINPLFPETLNIKVSRQKNRFCRWVFQNLSIMFNGNVTTCCCDLMGENTFANLYETSLLKLWHSKTMNFLRSESLISHKPKLLACNECSIWKIRP